jgi:hypothetical protein
VPNNNNPKTAIDHNHIKSAIPPASLVTSSTNVEKFVLIFANKIHHIVPIDVPVHTLYVHIDTRLVNSGFWVINKVLPVEGRNIINL